MNQDLRKQTERNSDLILPYAINTMDGQAIAEKLSINQMDGDIIMDGIWEKYESFHAFYAYDHQR